MLAVATMAAACGGGEPKSVTTETPSPTLAIRSTVTAAPTLAVATITATAGASSDQGSVAEAQRVLSQAAAGTEVPEATVDAARTELVPQTPAPPPPPSTPQATPTQRFLQVPGRTPLPLPPASEVSIDANPDNDGGPCNSIDAERDVSAGQTFSVALCLQSSNQEPINGKLNTITLELTYGAALTGVSTSGDGTLDLDGNPNFNDGPATGGAGWDCNLLDDPRAAPRAAPSPALLACTTLDDMDRSVQPGNVELATMTFQATQPGETQLSWGNRTGLLSGRRETDCSDNSMICNGATIKVQ